MNTVAKLLTGFSALAFALAVVSSVAGQFSYIAPEGFSRACSNLALLAIAFVLSFGEGYGPAGPRSNA